MRAFVPRIALVWVSLWLMPACSENTQPRVVEGDAKSTPPDPNKDRQWEYEPDPMDKETPVPGDENTEKDSQTEPDVKDPKPEDPIKEPPDKFPVTCPEGRICVTSFPFSDEGNNALMPPGTLASYSCKPSANESGPETVYQVTVSKAGFLSAAVYDMEGVDVDVHILSSLNGEDCLDRGDNHARADVEPGTWFVVVDTWVDGGGPLAGPFEVDIGFTVPTKSACEVETGVMKRVGDGGNHLQMPATGPVVLEAHLVTQEEPAPYPATATDELLEHYLLSQFSSTFVMFRSQNWAPLEGGSFYGAGIGPAAKVPVLDEHWYVCMYWSGASRPPRGTRMIFTVPGTKRGVVVAAGHETGPGNLNNIAGTVEEVHFYLGTGHKDELTLGIAKDQTLPFGPVICD